MRNYNIFENEGYEEWFKTESLKSRMQIRKRLLNIQESGHFGHIRDLSENGDGLHELKFNDGRRIYYIIIPIDNVILLLGGNKNGQDKDIKKSRNIIERAKQRAKIRGL